MTTPSSPDKPPPAEPPSTRWLTTIRTRLGLPQGPNLRETISEALKSRDETTGLTDAERRTISRALRFSSLKVSDVMVPRAEIIAIDEVLTIRDLLKTFATAGVSRVPVYRETLDDPKGMIHVKDVLKWLTGAPINGTNGHHGPTVRSQTAITRPTPVKPATEASAFDAAAIDLGHADLSRTIQSTPRLVREVKFAPDSMSATNLLIEMQASRVHMAVVIDEYGGTHGLVTIEDLIEQVMGEIEDEHDDEDGTNLLQKTPQGEWLALGRTPVSVVETTLGQTLMTEAEAENVDTLGGLVVTLAGRVPGRGELIKHASGFEFEVLEADPRRIKRLKVHAPKRPLASGTTPAGTAPGSAAPAPAMPSPASRS
jgi:CBS domain containing-hemolysin-like protein